MIQVNSDTPAVLLTWNMLAAAAWGELEEVAIALAADNSGGDSDCGNLCCAIAIWKPYIKTRESNKTATKNIDTITLEFNEKIKSCLRILFSKTIYVCYIWGASQQELKI